MKRGLLFIAGLFSVSAVSAGEFYESDTKHEVGIGVGYYTTTDLVDLPDGIKFKENDDDDDPYNVAEKDFSYTPAFNFHYYYKLSRKVKLGMDVTWQKTTANTYMKMTAVPDELIRQRDENLGNPAGQKAQREIDNIQEEIDRWQQECGTVEKKHLEFMPQIKLTLLSREHFALYQRYGLGVNLEFAKERDGSSQNSVYMNFCIAPLGLEFGGTQFKAYVEAPALSPQGLLHAGLKYEF